VRENRTHGSEGGEGNLPDPYHFLSVLKLAHYLNKTIIPVQQIDRVVSDRYMKPKAHVREQYLQAFCLFSSGKGFPVGIQTALFYFKVEE